MKTNGLTKWIMGALMGIALAMAGLLYANISDQVDVNSADVRRVDKSQAVILYELEGINEKLDRLLGE